ncbi:MAG: mismatch-specific DNA-glycosylase [Chloroflexi bacterium]|nr:mismatch-specific DNA-glycosylase [Chloroflexota bacterium]
MTEILPDVLDFGLVLVFCGTAASRISARYGAYYANPGNRFWQTLCQAGFTSRLYEPWEFHKLLDLRIGLTDVAKGKAGSDADLKQSDFNPGALNAKILRAKPQILAFTSKAAWRAWKGLPSKQAVSWGWQEEILGATRIYVLPSPSGAARRYWDMEPWLELAEDYRSRMRPLGGGENICRAHT